MIEEPDIVVAHAMWETHLRNDALTIAAGLGSHAPLRHKLLWGRYSEGELAMRKQWSRLMFFGHTPVANYSWVRANRLVPVVGPSVVMLDTAAALGPLGRLTAYCVETGRFLQADPLGRMVKPETAAEAR
jgi:hypothetical protein